MLYRVTFVLLTWKKHDESGTWD